MNTQQIIADLAIVVQIIRLTPTPARLAAAAVLLRAAADALENDTQQTTRKNPETIRGWLETLPDGYRERALANLVEARGYKHCRSLAKAIDWGLDWPLTEEREDFWYAVHRHALNPECDQLPPLPETINH